MILLRRVVEVYLDDVGGLDWRFCLLAASLLSDISMNNVTKGNTCSRQPPGEGVHSSK